MLTLELLRQYKIGPFAIFDTAIAYIGVLIVSPLLKKLVSKLHLSTPWYSWLWLTLPIAVVAHIIVRQSTPLMKILMDPFHVSFYIAILMLIAMTYMGVKDWKIKRIDK